MKNIITSSLNPQYNLNNHKSLEIFYLKKLFSENELDLSIVGNKCRNNDKIHFFKDISTNLEDVENIFIQLSTINFFGGVINPYLLKFTEKFSNLKDKNFHVLVNDPRIKPENPARILFERFGLCEEHINNWDYIFDNANYVFQGKDLNKFFNDDKERKTIKLDLFTYIFKNDVKLSNFVDIDNKEFDLLYYGDKRGSYRESKIRKYLSNSERDLLVGYKTNKVECSFINKVPHHDLQKIIDKSICSLIIGCKEHEDNIATFRLYETLASSTLCAIDIDYDPNKELIKNETLRNILYVKNKEDIKKLCSLYSKELIHLQHKELLRIFEEGNYELNIEQSETIKEQLLLF